MKRHLLKSMWARKRRLVGAGFAVVIGIAFLVATLVFSDGMRAGIDSLFTEGNSGTDVLVRSDNRIGSIESGTLGTVDADLVDELASLPEVDQAIPVVEGLAQVVAADGTPIGGEGPPTIGLNWFDYDRNPYVIVDGRAPRAAGEVMLDSGTARTGDLAVGDVTTVRVPHPETVTVVGIAELGSGKSLGGVTFAWFDTGTAQDLLIGTRDELTGVTLTAAPGVDPDALLEVVEPTLPAGTEALTGEALTAEANEEMSEDFMDFFETFLLVFAGIALLVGTFSIHNTLSILVAQRTRETALLRAIGASRRQVLISTTIEAVLLGVVASAIGLGVGLGLAYGLNAMLDAAGFGVPIDGLTLDTSTILTALIVGTAVTLVASIAPAIKASRVAPIAALRDVAVDRSASSKIRAALGALVTAGGIAVVVTASDTGDGALQRAGLGALVTLVGFVMVGPVVARTAAGLLGAPIAVVGGQSGKLARRNAMRNPRRTAGTASALMIGTAVVALFATFAASLLETFGDILDEDFTGDLVVINDNFSGVGISPELAGEIAALPEVELATPASLATLELDGRVEEPLTVVGEELDEVIDLGRMQGRFADLGDDGLAVSESFAEDRGWELGDVIPVEYADGETGTLTVRTIYESDAMMGPLMMSAAAWDDHAIRLEHFLIMIDVAEGASVEDARAAIQPLTERFGAPDVQDREEYLGAARAEIEQVLAVIYGLLGLAILIAVLGIANTLALSLHERTRELGLLRAVGQTRRQLRRTVRWESVIIAVFGTVGGVGLGTFLGWGLMEAMAASEGYGKFVAPVGTLAVIMLAAVAAGVLAAWRPARRASKLDVLEAIAVD